MARMNKGNRLLHEASLYLRQHGHDPVDWYPWGDEALQRARSENKPIFLSIGYSSCHWCHVMEEEVFQKEDVASLLNEHYVSIKVDREERPDIDAVYMDALQTMTGSGGWPLSIFLTPELKPFYGGTYYPHGHFVYLIARLHDLFVQERQQLELQARRVHEVVSTLPELRPGQHVDEEVLRAATEQAMRSFDAEWGGFNEQIKFPTPPRWTFLLHRYRKTGDPRLAQMLRTTLDAIASGGIRDHVGGGFHRYATERKWIVPHFEKMLCDNALLASLYLEASVALGEPAYAEVARDTLDFLLQQMRSERGGFFASIDADSPGGEGSYYVWSPEELEQIAGPEDGRLLAHLLGVTPQGNYGGKSVLTRRRTPLEVARGTSRSVEQVAALFACWRPALVAHRNRRPRPTLDRKVITAWNGLAIAALAQAGAVLDDDGYLAAAEQAARFLWTAHRREDGSLQRSSYEGVPANDGVLEDYAFFAQGLLALHQATQDGEYLRRALELVEEVRQHFRHPSAGFSSTSSRTPAPLGARLELLDSALPSGSAVMLQVMLQAAALIGKEAYREEVESTLAAFGAPLRRVGLEMAGWLDAAQWLLGPYYLVVIAGERGSDELRALLDAYRSLDPTQAVLALVGPEGPAPETGELMLPTRGKQAQQGRATAYVCHHGTCANPTHDPDELCRQLLAGWHC